MRPHDYEGGVCKNCGARYDRVTVSTWCGDSELQSDRDAWLREQPTTPPADPGSSPGQALTERARTTAERIGRVKYLTPELRELIIKQVAAALQSEREAAAAEAQAEIAFAYKWHDEEMERVKACEHIAEGTEGWEVLRNECPSTAAVASLRDAFAALTKERDDARAETADARGERDAYMASYDGVCKERDALKEQQDAAIATLEDEQAAHQETLALWQRVTIERDALRKALGRQRSPPL